MNKVCVIVGAGASHDVKNEGARLIDPNWQMPLARDLFDIDKHPVYEQVLKDYSGADVIAQEIAPLVNQGEFSIEQKLREFAYHRSDQLKEHYKFVPPYLRDLINNSADRYVSTPSNYIRLVTHLLEHIAISG